MRVSSRTKVEKRNQELEFNYFILTYYEEMESLFEVSVLPKNKEYDRHF